MMQNGRIDEYMRSKRWQKGKTGTNAKYILLPIMGVGWHLTLTSSLRSRPRVQVASDIKYVCTEASHDAENVKLAQIELQIASQLRQVWNNLKKRRNISIIGTDKINEYNE